MVFIQYVCYIFFFWRSEGVVYGVEVFGFFILFQEREVDYLKWFEVVFFYQAEVVAYFQVEFVELFVGFVSFVGQDEYQIVRFGIYFVCLGFEVFGGEKFIYRRFESIIFIVFDVNQFFCVDLWVLYLFCEFVYLFVGVFGVVFGYDVYDQFNVVKNFEVFILCNIIQFCEFYVEVQVWFVRIEVGYCFIVGYVWEFRQFDVFQGFEKVVGQFFEGVEYLFLGYKSYFVVNLCKFWLLVGMQVFILEVFYNLEVFVKIRNYQNLFEGLWVLWQCVELFGVYMGRYYKVVCFFWCIFDEEWCFNFQEVFI